MSGEYPQAFTLGSHQHGPATLGRSGLRTDVLLKRDAGHVPAREPGGARLSAFLRVLSREIRSPVYRKIGCSPSFRSAGVQLALTCSHSVFAYTFSIVM